MSTSEALFKSERCDPLDAPELQWDVSVTAGSYVVCLYLAELCGGMQSVGVRRDISTSAGPGRSSNLGPDRRPPRTVAVDGHLDLPSPDTVPAGWTGEATVSGTGSAQGATVHFDVGSGPAPAVTDVAVVSGGTITATVTVTSGGPPRDRAGDVLVTVPDMPPPAWSAARSRADRHRPRQPLGATRPARTRS